MAARRTRKGPLVGAVLALVWLLPAAGGAADEWRSEIERFASGLSRSLPPSGPVFVGEFRDATGEGTYYPFLDSVRRAFTGGLGSAGALVTVNPAQAKLFATVAFRAETGRLSLDAQMRDLWRGRIAASQSVVITAGALPPNWRQRTVADVARELVGKLQDAFVGQQLAVVVGGITGGDSQDAARAEFQEALRSSVSASLANTRTFRILRNPGVGGAARDAATLTGTSREGNAELTLQLHLIRGTAPPEELAVVATRVPVSLFRRKREAPKSYVFFGRGDGAERVTKRLEIAMVEKGYTVYDEGTMGQGADAGASAQTLLGAASESPAGYLIRVEVDVPEEPAGGIGKIKSFPANAGIRMANLSSGEVRISVEESQTVFGLTRSQALSGRGKNNFPARVAEPLVERFVEKLEALHRETESKAI